MKYLELTGFALIIFAGFSMFNRDLAFTLLAVIAAQGCFIYPVVCRIDKAMEAGDFYVWRPTSED